MLRLVGIVLAALLGPVIFVAAYLSIAHLAGWHVGPTGDKFLLLGAVLAGVLPVVIGRDALWIRIGVAALYAYPCAMLVGFYSLLLSCSMFRQCLS